MRTRVKLLMLKALKLLEESCMRERGVAYDVCCGLFLAVGVSASQLRCV